MWTGAQLRDGGSAAISETIEYDFGNALGKHGIYRDVPGLDPGSDITVRSPDAPDDLAVFAAPPDSTSYPATRLRIGDPDETVAGTKTYEISYSLDDLAPNGNLAWDAVGTGWTVPIDAAEVEVVAPWSMTDVRCVKGTTGSTDACEVTQPEPGHLVAQIGKLDAGEGATVFANAAQPLTAAPQFAGPIESPNDRPGTGILLPGLVAGGAALLAAAPASRLVRRRGRERVGVGGAADAAFGSRAGEQLIDSEKLAQLATIEFAPPEELTPAQGGIVLREAVEPQHKVAWLIQQAIDGAIDLEEGEPRHVHLRRTGFGDPESAPLLDGIFGGRGEIELGSYDSVFARGWSQVGASLDEWAASSGLWDPAGDRRKVWVRVLGILAFLAGGGIALLGGLLAAKYGWGWLIVAGAGGLLAGAGLAGALRAWELKVRTPRGAALYLRVESFRRFLAQSEAYHAEQAAARGVLREYTAWAVAVGELDRWSRAVNSATNIPDRSALSYVYFAPLIYSGTSSASTAPSSSGGGGGGGVGGGGGGGGGGSW
jgi:hypothetical protein